MQKHPITLEKGILRMFRNKHLLLVVICLSSILFFPVQAWTIFSWWQTPSWVMGDEWVEQVDTLYQDHYFEDFLYALEEKYQKTLQINKDKSVSQTYTPNLLAQNQDHLTSFYQENKDLRVDTYKLLLEVARDYPDSLVAKIIYMTQEYPKGWSGFLFPTVEELTHFGPDIFPFLADLHEIYFACEDKLNIFGDELMDEKSWAWKLDGNTWPQYIMAIQLEMFDKMIALSHRLENLEFVERIQNHRNIFLSCMAWRHNESYLTELGYGLSFPVNRAEQKVQKIMEEYLQKSRVIIKKYS